MASAIVKDEDVIFHFRDVNQTLVASWKQIFQDYPDHIKITCGDIFKGGPAVDAIVSPGNGFGFMNGKRDAVYINHFGKQMQSRVQKVIAEEYDGELLVGQAAVIPAYGPDGRSREKDWSEFNEGAANEYVIMAPTMRTPTDVANTDNAYLAFRAVILAVRKHNREGDGEPITEVLVPGLCTASGQMPTLRCAWQMLQAYETYSLGKYPTRQRPERLQDVILDETEMCEITCGDIFRDGPAVDAIVSPANSFGFMDGGIDALYTRHFGIQMQERLQKDITEEYDGELLMGQAAIIPAYGPEGRTEEKDWPEFNEGVAIKYLISAPTM